MESTPRTIGASVIFSDEWRKERVKQGDYCLKKAFEILNEIVPGPGDKDQSQHMLMEIQTMSMLAHASYAAANVRGRQ